MLAELAGKRVILLQGPAGPFFRRVARRLRSLGAQVTKVNFNGGEDVYFPGPGVVRFVGSLADWPGFFDALAQKLSAHAIVLFGDCRPLHRVAIERAHTLGLDVYVFEEGYLRPDFVTLEKGGVNGFSSIPRDPAFYRAVKQAPLPEPKRVKHAFAKSAVHTICYATSAALLSRRYPEYRHHRDIRPLHQAALWLKSGVRRVAHTLRDRELSGRLRRSDMPPYFLVPLQVHLDSQLSHSGYAANDDFIAEVVSSFARHAPADHVLVLKHHPMDRPYRDYSALIEALRAKHGLGERLLYVDIIDLPTALRQARGTVVINSTVGLSSVHHGTPVKCLGKAVYDMPGLAFQGPLQDFWREPGSVDRDLYQRFRYWLRTNNQLNGSVWSDLCD